MNDLRDRIEIRLAEMQNTDGAYCAPCMVHVECAACQEFIDVITGVLDQHKPYRCFTRQWVKGEEVRTQTGDPYCETCSDATCEVDHPLVLYPCPTVQDIAESLGIEVEW